ncbi:class F sortase [Phycicoccus sonneratiae]|uniref:Class F sortase n=1 Tax=Phycicoccus sonneratiae TaxID=2807628 RepID=A0ABS2CJA4_9MICO|nr:class F sortase [Phycicoccus sonneraticus]MBM6399965.1 class F sortase [Phycicoccus sonneraticus]
MPTPRPEGSRRAVLAAAGSLALGYLAACSDGRPAATTTPGTATPTPPSPPPVPTPSSTPVPTTTATQRAAKNPKGRPDHVVLVRADGETIVDAPVRPVGLDDRGILSPPGGVVGWYDEEGWPRPGYPGASILAGHVGTPSSGADVFRLLPRARRGDRVTVRYDSGDVVHFVVERSAGMPKTQTPEDDSIWDAGNPRPLLRLITCDPTTPLESGHYEGNWVLWADLA